MMANEYSVLGASAPIISRVPASMVASASPMVGTETPFVVVPRSAVGTQMMPTFLSADMGAMPMTSQFTSLGALPSATTLADGTPLYTDSTVFKVLNTGGLPLANTTSLFASSTQPQGTNLSTLGELDGNIPSLASPRSLGAIPTVTNTTPVGAGSTPDLLNFLVGLIGSNNGDGETNPNAVSNEELLGSIEDLKAAVLEQEDRDNEEMNPSEEATNPKTLTLVSASPSLAAAEA